MLADNHLHSILGRKRKQPTPGPQDQQPTDRDDHVDRVLSVNPVASPAPALVAAPTPDSSPAQIQSTCHPARQDSPAAQLAICSRRHSHSSRRQHRNATARSAAAAVAAAATATNGASIAIPIKVPVPLPITPIGRLKAAMPMPSNSATESIFNSPPEPTERSLKRPRHHISSSTSSTSSRSCIYSHTSSPRRTYRKRRAYSLPNIHLQQHSMSNPPSARHRTPHSSCHSDTCTHHARRCRAALLQSQASQPATAPQSSGPTTKSSSSRSTPSLYPLINRETLRELDLEAILRNPQLRHDLLYDAGLQFQPTTSHRKRDATYKYWIAVQRELLFGCRCTAFDKRGSLLACICASCPHGCRQQRCSRLTSYPSRIPPLINELLEVLLTVIAPFPSPPPNESEPGSADLEEIPNLPPPSPIARYPSFSAQETQLRAALDADLIQQELQHGIFDPSGLFLLIGGMLKCHCAPMRDKVVDAMVQISQTSRTGDGIVGAEEAVTALRMCFEILELMKLDIVNHQLLTLRPYLITTSSDFELRAFQERSSLGLTSLTITRRWLRTAFEQIKPTWTTTPATVFDTSSIISESSIPNNSRSEIIHMAMVRAIIETVFSPGTPPQTSVFPETLYLDHSRLVTFSQQAMDLLALYLLLMLYRQLCLANHNSNSSVVNSRGGGFGKTGKFAAALKKLEEAQDMEAIKLAISQIGPPRLGECFSSRRSEAPAPLRRSVEEEAESDPAAAAGNSNNSEAETRLADVLLHLAAYSVSHSGPQDTASPSPSLSPPYTSSVPPDSNDPESAAIPIGMTSEYDHSLFTSKGPACQLPSRDTMDLLNRWMATNFKPGSPLSELLRQRLIRALVDVTMHCIRIKDTPYRSFFHSGSSSSSSPTSPSSTAFAGSNFSLSSLRSSGLEVLYPELHYMGENIANLATCHWRVYAYLYEAEGFLA